MSKIKPMELIARMSGKVCGHSNVYFAVRNGTQYTGTICNPYTGEPTDKQISIRTKFQTVIANMAALSTEEIANYKLAFRKQKKYPTLRGFIFAKEYAKL